MKKITLLTLVFLFVGVWSFPAKAQTSGQIVDTTIPVDTEVREAITDWLAVNPPVASVPYYAITYAQSDGLDTLVSLVGLDLGNPADEWRLFDHGVWLGSVRVTYNGDIIPLIPQSQARALKVFAVPFLEAGGGSNVRFPWQMGKGIVYGRSGVHAGAYGVPNGVAVDLLGGADLGTNIADASVYASIAGEVDYVCEDGTSVAVRLYSEETNDYFAYAHLLDNANLELEHEFAQSAVIGTLKYGSFEGNCGNAEQQDSHYHLHWVFQPANDAFRAEGCILDIDSQYWNCAGGALGAGAGIVGSVAPGEVLYHTTFYDNDDPLGVTQTTFFDNLLVGLISIFDRGVIKLLPEHTSPSLLLRILQNTIVLVFRVAFVLLKGNFNLGPLMAMLSFALFSKVVMGSIFLVVAVFRAIKSLVPGLP